MASINIRAFRSPDAAGVRDLFIRVNRALAPDGMAEAFEAYIARSLEEEIDRVETYFAERRGAFFVAESTGTIVGMFGLEDAGSGAAELRRMYVDPDRRGLGLGRQLLDMSERAARDMGFIRMALSTSELQGAALALYRTAGYTETHEEVATAASNKTLGGGLRRFHFEKVL